MSSSPWHPAGPVLEIAVQDPAGAAIARTAGADRIELCAALGVTGGLTPSPGTLRACAGVWHDAPLPAVHVLLRNRPGGFVYSPGEISVLVDDVALAVELGASGVVIGALTPDAELDLDGTRRLVDAARTAERAAGRRVEVTFHRAMDVAADPVAALRTLAGLGVDRVLTSGGAARVGLGLAELGRLVEAGTGVQIMAGGGVTIDDIAPLCALGVDAVHLSAKTVEPDPGAAGPGGGTAGDLEVTSPETVERAYREIRRCRGGGT